MIKRVFPFAGAGVFIGKSKMFSSGFEVRKIQYQRRGPENYKNTKFGKHSGEWNFLIIMVCNINNCFIFRFGYLEV